MALQDSLERLYRFLRLYLLLLLLRLQLFVRQQIEYRTSPSKSSSRTFLIIGDAVALGLGDIPGHCGLSTRIPALLRSRRDQTSLALHWHTVTAAKLYSKAADWLPGPPDGLFHRAFIKGPFRDADLVLVVLGAHDDLVGGGAKVVDDIVTIVEGVVRLGKHALVATLPNEHPHKSAEHAELRRLNDMLKSQLQLVKQQNAAPHHGSVSLDVDMAKVYAMGNHVLSFENHFIALNASGYRLLANEVFDPFVVAAKKVEWAHWKDILSPN